MAEKGDIADYGWLNIMIEMLFRYDRVAEYQRREDTEYLEIFFNNIHHIRESHIFWRIVPIFWNIGGSYDDRWLTLFKKHQRKEPLLFRTNCFRKVANNKYEKGSDLHISSNRIRDYENNYLNGIGINQPILVYRAFQVRQGKPIRKGVRKVDNPHAHLQEEGKGISFSLSKMIATRFLHQTHNSFYYKTYLGINDIEEMKKILAPQLGDGAGLGMILRENVYSCVGTFAIKKKDIIASNLYNGEEEILADPADFEFTNFYDAIAVDYIMRIVNTSWIYQGGKVKFKIIVDDDGGFGKISNDTKTIYNVY